MNDISQYSEKTFDDIKHYNDDGIEFWYARELQEVLDYSRWEKFYPIINKAKDACQKSGNPIEDHFVPDARLVELGSGAFRQVDDVILSRYACYLIVMNGDPRKEVIALGQTYFAVKTRQQELIEDYDQLTEDNKRLAIRAEMKKHNKSLADAAHQAGVTTSLDYAIFQNHGYMGLYGGLKKADIQKRKGLKPKEEILDHMGSIELAANLFRATQTEDKLRRDHIKGKEAANQTHLAVGRKVRQTIKELGGTMPEDLPTPDKSIKQLEKEQKKLNSGKA